MNHELGLLYKSRIVAYDREDHSDYQNISKSTALFISSALNIRSNEAICLHIIGGRGYGDVINHMRRVSNMQQISYS